MSSGSCLAVTRLGTEAKICQGLLKQELVLKRFTDKSYACYCIAQVWH